MVWKAGRGVSSKRSIPSSTSLLIPKDGQFGGTGMGRERESSSAFMNSFQGQKPSRAQTLNCPQQAPLVATAIHSPLRLACTDCRTAWRRRKRGSPPPAPRGTSHVGAGPQQQPRDQAREWLNQVPPNPLPPSGGGGGWGHVSENSGRKQTHTHLPMLTAGQF